MDMATEVSAISELVVALEKATLMTKQLPNVTDPSQIVQIYSALHSAHHNLSFFLTQATHHPNLPQPSLLLHPSHLAAAAENSVSSAVGNGHDNEPMQLGDDDEEADAEQNSRTIIERVEERMRDCFIQNKRPKRARSPSAVAATEQQNFDKGFVGFDPHKTRRRSLDLIYQFHA